MIANTASSSDYDVSPSDIALTFLPNGVTRQYFNVTPVDDLRVENDETITAILTTTDPLAVIIVREMQITIKDNDSKIISSYMNFVTLFLFVGFLIQFIVVYFICTSYV